MKSIILKIVIFIFALFIIHSIFSAFIPIDTVFNDINKDYKYFNELQELYNKQVFYPDESGKFNPNKILTRDEFVSAVMETSCNKCTKPNASIEIIDKYKNSAPFFDVLDSNNYSYCISLANDKNYIDSYSKGYKCDDGTVSADKIPFCPNNYVSLEEAVSIILRNSNLFSVEDNNSVLADIANGKITEKLADDVGAKNIDGSTYKYYGYIKKALEYSIEEYDSLGNKKVYKLIDLSNGKVYPQKLITKEKFLKMAYIASKTNSCQNIVEKNLTNLDGKTGTESVVSTETTDSNCEDKDSDNDGINDCDDLCPDIYGKTINKGCPIYDLCNSDCTCSNGRICTLSNKSLCGIKGVCVDDTSKVNDNNKTNDCLEKYNSRKIYGNVVCNSCPCINFIDFTSNIRKCDYLFPAITSTGSNQIYSAGTFFEVK
ncbi:MAG: S-layer homology domain-containing protein [Candidatus Gracilibacteria bacterium]